VAVALLAFHSLAWLAFHSLEEEAVAAEVLGQLVVASVDLGEEEGVGAEQLLGQLLGAQLEVVRACLLDLLGQLLGVQLVPAVRLVGTVPLFSNC